METWMLWFLIYLFNVYVYKNGVVVASHKSHIVFCLVAFRFLLNWIRFEMQIHFSEFVDA